MADELTRQAEADARATADAKRARILAVKDPEWQAWRHNPITASYLQYLEDQIDFFRNAAADMLEAGQFLAGTQHQDRNPDVLRGQIIALRQLHDLELAAIHAFYGQELPEEQ